MAVDLQTLYEGMTHRQSCVYRPSIYNTSPFVQGARNSYLALYIDVNPRIISRIINQQMMQLDPMLRHHIPPLMRMTEALPNVYAPKVDKTRAREAFLRRKLPRLRRDLDGNTHTMTCALFTLADVLHDPERVPEAVRAGIHERLPPLMFHKKAVVRERCLAVIESMSNITVGRDAVLDTPKLLRNIKALMFDEEDAVRFRAALALRMLVFFRAGPFDMDEGALAPFLVYVLHWEEDPCVIAVLLFSLERLLELKSTKEECINHGAFDILEMLMRNADNEVVTQSLLCMGRLASCAAGENYNKDTHNHFTNSLTLRSRLNSEDPEVAAAAATFLMHITNTTYGKQAATNNCLHETLLKMVKSPKCRRAQMVAFQTLNNMADDPNCRSALTKEDLDFAIEDPDVDRVRQRLVKNLRRGF